MLPHGNVNYRDTIGQFLFCLFGFITRTIELDKTIKIYIAFYYLSDAIGPFFFFWFIIRRIALDKTMNKKREYYILLSDATMKKEKENISFYYLKYIKEH